MNFYIKKYHLLFFLIASLFSSCLFEDEFEIEPQRNQGFLSYDSGFGVTEGIKILPYSTDIDSGYILLGNTDTGLDENYFLVKTDSDGRILESVSFGDLDADNEAVDMIIEDDNIFVLGNAFDKNLDRVIPATAAFFLDDLSPLGIFQIDFSTAIDTSGDKPFIYEEKSDGFIFFEDEKVKVVVSTVLDVFDQNLGKVYLINSDFDLSNDIKDIDRIVIDTTNIPAEIGANAFEPGDKISFTMGGVKKLPSNLATNPSFLVSATVTLRDFRDTVKSTYFYLARYEVQGDLLERTNEWYYKTFSNNELEAFEIIGTNPLRIMVLNSEDNFYYGDLYELPDQVRLITEFYDFIEFGPNKQEGKAANLSKVEMNGTTNLFVTTVQANNALYVERLELDDNLRFVRPWYAINDQSIDTLSLWTTSQSLNNIWSSAASPPDISYFPSLAYNKQLRNNVGNVIAKWDEKEAFCIIGTHDFLDVSKMIMMQIDKDGEYLLE